MPRRSRDRPGSGSSPTVEQLRAQIDAGRTGDKVAGSDPAAVPLGADDEAAGAPPSRERIALAHRQEVGRPTKSRPGHRGARKGRRHGRQDDGG